MFAKDDAAGHVKTVHVLSPEPHFEYPHANSKRQRLLGSSVVFIILRPLVLATTNINKLRQADR